MSSDEINETGSSSTIGNKQFVLLPAGGERAVYVQERSGDSATYREVSGLEFDEALETDGRSFDVVDAQAEEWLASEANRLAALVAAIDMKPSTVVYLACQFKDPGGNPSSVQLSLSGEITGSGQGIDEILNASRRDTVLRNLRSAVMGLTPPRLAAYGIVGPLTGLEILFVEVTVR